MSASKQDDTLFERLAIREVIERYADLLNHRDWDAYEQLLTADLQFHTSAPVNVTLHSRAEMMKLVRDTYKAGFVFQMAHNIIVDRVVANHARARHTLHVFSDRFRLLALYYDSLVRGADNRWRFSRRDVRVTYYEEGTLPGKVYRTLPDLDTPAWYHQVPTA
jgi:hypothetical protein